MTQGAWVLCDRFADSTFAYQGYGHNVPIPFIEQLYDAVVGDFAPDLTLVLDIDAEVGLGRANTRNADNASREDRFERMDLSFHERLRQGFLEIARNAPERCAVIDADHDPDIVSDIIRAMVNTRLLAA
jgi:dTMP kinase